MKMRSLAALVSAILSSIPAWSQTEWRIINSGISGNLKKVVFDGNLFYATDGSVYRSGNGAIWTMHLASGNYDPVVSIVACQGGALFIGSYGYWAPGKTYQKLPSYGTNVLDSAYLNGVAVVTGMNGNDDVWRLGRYLDATKTITSVNVPWTGASSWAIATDKEFLVAAGGGIYASEDGASWALRSRVSVSQRPFWWNGILFSRNQISYDLGKTWDYYAPSITPDAFGAGTLIRREYNGLVATSKDALKWDIQETGNTTNLNGIAFGKNTFVAVGFNGQIITSSAADPLPFTPTPKLTISPSVTLKWPSVQGMLYQPEASENLKTWAAFGGPIPGTGSEISRSFEITDQRKFFRVTVR